MATQRAADINRQQEHQVHNEEEDRQAEEAVEDHFIHRRGKAAGLGGKGVALTASQMAAMLW